MMTHSFKCLAAAAAMSLAAPFAVGATVPVIVDFDDGTDGPLFDTTSSLADDAGNFTPNNQAYDFVSAQGQNHFSVLELTDGTADPFTMTAEVTVDSFVGTDGVGFVAFAGTDTPAPPYYLLDVNSTNGVDEVLRIVSVGDEGLADSAAFDVVPGTVYTFTATFAPNEILPTSLDISFTVSDGITSETVSFTDATPNTGDFFGFRVRQNNPNSTLSGTIDNFAIVPEPASLALVGVGGLMVLARGRRSA